MKSHSLVTISTRAALIVLSVFLTFTGAYSDSDNPVKFRRLAIEDGLSQSSVYCFLQDNRGFVWMATEDGLNRYDGYNFKIYKNKVDDPSSLSYNYVKSIIQDRSGVIWVGTYGGGLNRFETDKERFQNFRSVPDDPSSLSSNFINSISEDSAGFLWIGTIDGLNKFDPRTGRCIRYNADPDPAKGLNHKTVSSVCVDRSGMVWIGTSGGGLDRFDPVQEKFTCFKNKANDSSSLSNDVVRTVYQDRKGTLWIGTENGLNALDNKSGRIVRYRRNTEGDSGGLSSDIINAILETRRGDLWVGTADGLNRLDPHTGRVVVYKNNPNDSASLSHDDIFALLEDRSGTLWVGTHVNANTFDQERKPFRHYKHDPNNPSSIGDDFIRAVFEDSSGVLWIGGNAGLNRYDREKNGFSHYTNNPHDPFSLSNDQIKSVCEDRSGALWVGTNMGLNRLNRKQGTFSRYLHKPNDSRSLSTDRTRVLFLDSDGVLWIGTEEGLNRFNEATGDFSHYFRDPAVPGSLSNDYVYVLAEDKSGALWIGTLRGLNRLDRKSGRITRFLNEPGNSESLINDEILSLWVDHRGVLWVGTTGGLCKFDGEHETFKSYTEKNGLPNDMIYCILEDDADKLWLSTNRGLSRFDPKTEKFRNYDLSDGLQSNEFMLGSRLKSRRGELYFGGINGVTAFYPGAIKDNSFVPPVMITDFQISNRSVAIGEEFSGRPILAKSITETDELKLSYKESFLSFEFSALNFINSQKNRYAYKMEGFDRDWIDAGTRRFVTYTNLPPRSYTFKVKGSNNDGVWNEEGASLRIVITPPFWRTWWFLTLAGLTILALILAIYRYRTLSIRETARKLEKRVKERTTELMSANEKLHKEINERERTEEALRISEEKYRSLANQIPLGLYRSTLDGQFLYVNPALAAILEYDSVDDLLKTPVENIFLTPQGRAAEIKEWKAKTGGDVVSSEVQFKTKNGRPILVRDTGRFISTGKEGTEYFDGIIEDITERKRSEELIRSALKEKEVLLKEIHHRVKNNMQIISSLLRLQAMSFKDERMMDVFNTSQNRIRSMALVHEGLYQSVDLASINFSEYLERLTSHLFMVYRRDSQNIQLHLDVKHIFLDVNKAIPCGLIINELVTNALKHAFPDGRSGDIHIRMIKADNGSHVLIIKDTGVGFPEGMDFRSSSSLGMQIVTDLIEQLEGTIEICVDSGTEFRVVF